MLVRDQNKRIEQQTFLMEAGRRQSIIPFMLDLMEEIDLYVERVPNRESPVTLPTRLVSRIGSLTKDLMPYRTLDSISGELSTDLKSPERGQVLLFLVSSGVNLLPVAKTASFAASDLAGADLHGVHLEAIDLAGANLWGADLHDANFSGAKLNGTNLWSARLQRAQLRGADLTTASLWGADLTDADARAIDFTEAVLRGATFRRTDMRDAVLENVAGWQNIKDMTRANIYGVKRAPPGFVESAHSRGAVDLPGDDWRDRAKESPE